ncbi:MAG: hypothetical protein RLY71_1989 [Pseudomonadota bacterium]|jgi:hypothetical protein
MPSHTPQATPASTATAGALLPAAEGCTCPLTVGQPLAQTCPHCRALAAYGHGAAERVKPRKREQRQHHKFTRDLARIAKAR